MIRVVISNSPQLTKYDHLRTSLKGQICGAYCQQVRQEHDRLLASLQTQVLLVRNSLALQLKGLEKEQVDKGTAKNRWLKYGQQHNLVTCAVAAPTGIAAFNVGGVNICLFQLLIEHEGQTTGYWSLPKASQKITRKTFQQVKLFTFD